MTIERSHGKARPTLPRASDLQPGETATTPPTGRTPGGHFARGNRLAVGGRFKRTVAKSLGEAHEGDAGIVASDAARVARHVIASLPSDAPPVRVLVSIHARHVALNAYFTSKAEAAGLDTDRGLQLLAIASRESQRAERVLISALDTARVCAQAADKPSNDPLGTWRASAIVARPEENK